MELMANGLSFVVVARIVNAALEDYGIITAEDTSQSTGNYWEIWFNYLTFSGHTNEALQRKLKVGDDSELWGIGRIP